MKLIALLFERSMVGRNFRQKLLNPIHKCRQHKNLIVLDVDLAFDEEVLFGRLNVTICRLQGVTDTKGNIISKVK